MPKSDIKYVIDDDVSGAVLSSGAGTVASTFDETQADVWLSKKTTDDVAEGASNLYYSDARVSANSDVTANTAARHDAVTAGTLITLTGQQVSVDLTGSPTWTGLHQFNSRVGIGAAADSQFMLDVNGAIRGTYLVGKHAIQLSDATLLCHYDGGTEMNFYADPATHLGQPPTRESGSVVGVKDGKFNGAVSLTEGFTNLILNPVFENNVTDGWTARTDGTGGTVTQDTTTSYVGNASCKCLASDSGVVGVYNYALCTLADSDTVVAQYRVTADAGALVKVQISDGTTAYATDTFTISETGWIQREFNYTNNTGAAITLGLRLFNATADSASVMWFDAVQFVESAHQLPFRFGDMPGCEWSGTAHNSTTTVTASRLEYDSDVLSADAGTIAAWIKPRFVDTTQRYIARHYDSANYIYIATYSDASSFRVRVGDTAAVRGTVDVGNWQYVALTWENGTAAFYVNGALSGSTWSYSNAAVGSNPLAIFASEAGTYHASGEIDDLVILNRAASADEIRAIYESNAPVFAETSVRTFQTGNDGNRVWLNENGLFAEDDAGLPSFALANADGITWNGETLDTRDVLLGDNSTGAANIYFDASAGTFSIRGGTTEQVKIAADGSLQAGGGKVTLGTDFTTEADTGGIDPFSTIGYAFVNTTGTRLGGVFGGDSSTKTIALWSGDLTSVNDNVAEVFSISGASGSATAKLNVGQFSGGTTTKTGITVTHGKINIYNIPTSSTGLSTGDIWNDSGTLKIV